MCKERCGLLGVGAKLSLDYQYNTTRVTPLNNKGNDSALRKRNLDGEAGNLIRPTDAQSERSSYSTQQPAESQIIKRPFPVTASKIGSI